MDWLQGWLGLLSTTCMQARMAGTQQAAQTVPRLAWPGCGAAVICTAWRSMELHDMGCCMARRALLGRPAPVGRQCPLTFPAAIHSALASLAHWRLLQAHKLSSSEPSARLLLYHNGWKCCLAGSNCPLPRPVDRLRSRLPLLARHPFAGSAASWRPPPPCAPLTTCFLWTTSCEKSV